MKTETIESGDLLILADADDREGATLNAPALAEVGGWLYVREGATVDAPALAKVGGSLYVRRGATLHAALLGYGGPA